MCECVCVCVWFQTGRNSNPIGKHKFQNISQIYPPLFIIVSLSQSRATVSLTKTTTTIFVYLYPLYLGPSIVTYIGNSLLKSIHESHHTHTTLKNDMIYKIWPCLVLLFIVFWPSNTLYNIHFVLPTRVFCFSNCCISFCPRYAL